MKYVFPLDQLPENKNLPAGGKARSLANMLQNTKLRIPHGYVILADAINDAELCDEAQAELNDLIKKLDAGVTYAVRSSAVNEDGDRASFAGQYETVTDVPKEEIAKAVRKVAASAQSANVTAYVAGQKAAGEEDFAPDLRIGIIIQRFVRADFAGVVFTADAITGKDDGMVGNYVKGAGEKLVSGTENAQTFTMGAIKYAYDGPAEFGTYAKTLCRYCTIIRNLYGMPMDIEWAVADGKVYILQARPITTLKRLDMDDYNVNGTYSGYKILTKTNVGEIFMKPVSPMTFSVLEKINDVLGIPEWLDNVWGQPYMNVSVTCSIAVAFGKEKEKAYESLKSLVGRVPEEIQIPISPFDKKAFLKKIWKLFFPKEKSKLTKKQKKAMVRDLADIARSMIGEVREIGSEQELYRYWTDVCVPKLRDGMASIIGQSGTSMLPLFTTRARIGKIAGGEMADRLCGGCLGTLESMKPLLLISDVIDGRITKEEYVRICGHRCPNEMELMAKRPYEDEAYVDGLIEARRDDKLDVYQMQAVQKAAYEEALEEFKKKFPGKKRWVDKRMGAFVRANAFREDLRSKGVWIFCVFREWLLRAGKLTGLGDDVFMLTFDEVFEYLQGDKSAGRKIPARRKTYERYLTCESFPNVLIGRFDPKEWMADEHRRRDVYVQDVKISSGGDAKIRGFAGAAGVIRGRVRVITDIEKIGDVRKGDVLVTSATNVGWTPVFTKVSAIVTDVGAPLSHAAIVARECGIPAVVGCGNATTLLHTGDEVIVDGSAGTVKLV